MSLPLHLESLLIWIIHAAANRLDRPTSGLMLIGLNSERARQFESQMVQGKIQKEYVCRVVGEFPE